MNLTDIVKRKDRSFVLVKGSVESIIHSALEKKYHAVRVAKKSHFKLLQANEFYVLRSLPNTIGWQIAIDGIGSGIFKFYSVSTSDETRRHLLFEAKLRLGEQPRNVELDWPIWAGERAGYHLEIEYHGDSDLIVLVGCLINSRRKLIPQLHGMGVEVGPGLNPHVLPSPNIDIKYVETVPADQWVALYKKQDKPSNVALHNLWGSYIVGNAHILESVEDESLDFIFSNHVFEHLVNPLGVLENWARKLKRGGIIAGVVPDCRYTFDLRQHPSNLQDFSAERADGRFEISHEKYIRWCKYTAPYNTPADLIQRQYSIHVHYYTPGRFADMLEIFEGPRCFESVFFDGTTNNKDFAFLLRV